MGFFIGQGYADVVGDENDIESMRNTIFSHFSEDASIFSHFSEDASIPETRTELALLPGYSGALRCLSEGEGAFVPTVACKGLHRGRLLCR